MANIYLGTKEGSYECSITTIVKVTINVSKSTYEECRNFEVVTYSITYPGLYEEAYITSYWNFHSYTNLFIYTGSKNKAKDYIYAYRPNKNDNIVRKIDSYYYLSDTDTPIGLVFSTRDDKKRYYSYKELTYEGKSNALKGSIIRGDALVARLKIDCESFKDHKKILFVQGTRKDLNVLTKSENIGTDKKIKKVTLVLKPEARSSSGIALNSSNLFTLNPKNNLKNENDSYPESVKDKKFNGVIVYYTDSSNEPENLALLIEFLNDCEKVHIKRTNNDPPRWLEEKVYYNNEEELIKELDVIKKESESVIIYKLEKNVNSDYNIGRIQVNGSRNRDFNFIGYNHTPTRDYKNKTSLLYYKGYAIKLVTNNSISKEKYGLKTLDNLKLKEASTYVLSDKEKEHLLIKLTEKSGTNYYLHRFNKDGTQWRQLSLEELKVAGIKVNDGGEEGLDKKLDTLLGESQHTNVNALLKYISFCVNSLVIFLDEKLTYYHSDIKRLISNEIPPIDIDTNAINVTHENNGPSTKCLASKGYQVHNHDLQRAGQFATAKSDGFNLYLRFYVGNSQIMLYDSPEGNHTPLEYKYNMNLVYVFFYGEKDPRPLLLCYNDKAYRPYSIDDYDKKWVKVDKNVRCKCESDDGNNKELLNTLSTVIGFLNVVQMDQTCGLKDTVPNLAPSSSEEKFYKAQTFKGKPIKFKVSYDKKDSYLINIHEPYGFDGNGEGFRMGNIRYSNNDKALVYDLGKNLKSLSAYYVNSILEYPLLVILQFENGSKEYHKAVKGSDQEKKWVLMDGQGSDKDFVEMMEKLSSESEVKRSEMSGLDEKPVNIEQQNGQMSPKKGPQPSDSPKTTNSLETTVSRENSRTDMENPKSGILKPETGNSSVTPGLQESKGFETEKLGQKVQPSQPNLPSGQPIQESNSEVQNLIANKMSQIQHDMDPNSSNQEKIGKIAGGTASGGVGLAGSVVGYLAYARYCKP